MSCSVYNDEKIRPFTCAVWAIDPTDNLCIDSRTLANLARWAASSRGVIHPVFVFTPTSDFEALAADLLADLVQDHIQRLGLQTEKPTIVVQPRATERSAAQELLEIAEAKGADLVILSSHGRKGLPRLFFGSFAERLIRASHLPVLVLNQYAADDSYNDRHAIFATDFSEASRLTFQRFLVETRNLIDRVTLFHDSSVPLELSLYAPRWGFSLPSTFDYLEERGRWLSEVSDSWLIEAHRQGVSASYQQLATGASLARTIAFTARQSRAGVIAMGARLGPFMSMLFGSSARDLIAESHYPVLIYGPGTQPCSQLIHLQPDVSA